MKERVTLRSAGLLVIKLVEKDHLFNLDDESCYEAET